MYQMIGDLERAKFAGMEIVPRRNPLVEVSARVNLPS
jgi:hypothetical protein